MSSNPLSKRPTVDVSLHKRAQKAREFNINDVLKPRSKRTSSVSRAVELAGASSSAGGSLRPASAGGSAGGSLRLASAGGLAGVVPSKFRLGQPVTYGSKKGLVVTVNANKTYNLVLLDASVLTRNVNEGELMSFNGSV